MLLLLLCLCVCVPPITPAISLNCICIYIRHLAQGKDEEASRVTLVWSYVKQNFPCPFLLLLSYTPLLA